MAARELSPKKQRTCEVQRAVLRFVGLVKDNEQLKQS